MVMEHSDLKTSIKIRCNLLIKLTARDVSSSKLILAPVFNVAQISSSKQIFSWLFIESYK